MGRELYAINPDGTQKWVFNTGGSITSSPAIGADGTIYVGSHDGKFYAVNLDGTQKWAITTGDSINSSPAIGTDWTVYFGSEDHKLYAINTTCGGFADAPWPMLRHDVRHTGNVSQVGSLTVSLNFNKDTHSDKAAA